MRDIWINKYDQKVFEYSKVRDYHVTVLYIGQDEEVIEDNQQLYDEFQDDQEIEVEVTAIVIAPGKIITGVCFPNHPTASTLR